jgi:malic enzyme
MKGKTETWEEAFDKLTTECFSGDAKKLKYFTWKFKEKALKDFISTVYQPGKAEAIEEVKKIIPKPFPYPEKSSMPAEWCSGYNSFRKVLVRRIKELHQSTREVL